MKVLFVNRPKFWWTGGDYFQMEQTAYCLRRLGVEVDIIESSDGNLYLDPSKYDIIHTFNFSMAWSKVLLRAKRTGQKFVSSMIYHETEQQVLYSDQQRMLDSLDAAIFLTMGEIERVKRHLQIPEKLVIANIENGIEPFWFHSTFMGRLKQIMKHPFVLTVGRVDESKGQYYVMQACQRLKVNYISIGGEQAKINEQGVTFLPDMRRESLRPYYEACAVFALVSDNELMPLTVMEAGAQAKNIVITNGCEWKIPNAEYVYPKHVNSIAEGISRALKKPANVEFKEMLEKMTWDVAAEKILNLYKTLI